MMHISALLLLTKSTSKLSWFSKLVGGNWKVNGLGYACRITPPVLFCLIIVPILYESCAVQVIHCPHEIVWLNGAPGAGKVIALMFCIRSHIIGAWANPYFTHSA